ncbi:hypothetical protein ID866_5735 [Astraeus odoratus]|nr:hypothetical protein ID866_5735 [Astraeus odoratus]
MRLYALYNRSRRIMLVVVSCYVLEIFAMIAMLVMANLTSGTDNQPTPGLTFCTNVDVSNTFYVFWLPLLAYESLLCFLAIRAGIKWSGEGSAQIKSNSRLWDVLVRGNVIYFLA